jgi:hypothetical protein
LARACKYAALGIFLLAMALATWHVLAPRWSPINAFFTRNALPAVPRSHRPSTLDPALFTGAAAEAYRIAFENPALLEALPCYCGCYFKDGHQNLLDCFRDRHAESCEHCQKIAQRADELARKGYAAEDIKPTLDREFAPK